ncbi:unnamed protein product, partial [Amoebophrya sp. A120]|eukprot:GSA120T00022951001.1
MDAFYPDVGYGSALPAIPLSGFYPNLYENSDTTKSSPWCLLKPPVLRKTEIQLLPPVINPTLRKPEKNKFALVLQKPSIAVVGPDASAGNQEQKQARHHDARPEILQERLEESDEIAPQAVLPNVPEPQAIVEPQTDGGGQPRHPDPDDQEMLVESLEESEEKPDLEIPNESAAGPPKVPGQEK